MRTQLEKLANSQILDAADITIKRQQPRGSRDGKSSALYRNRRPQPASCVRHDFKEAVHPQFCMRLVW